MQIEKILSNKKRENTVAIGENRYQNTYICSESRELNYRIILNELMKESQLSNNCIIFW